jgi:hypothetical protein
MRRLADLASVAYLLDQHRGNSSPYLEEETWTEEITVTEASTNSTKELPQCDAKIESAGDRVTFAFPKGGGVIRSAKWEFADQSELVDFLAETLGMKSEAGTLRGTVRRRGKYVRHDDRGRKTATFGDPILDLITNVHGELSIGGQRISLGAADLRAPSNQIGGLSSVDLTVNLDEATRLDVAQAARGESEQVLTESTGEAIALATVRSRTFVRNGHKMRFRAWKKNLALYWSMGAEIETWGRDFERARIESRYLDTVVGQTCAAVKVDSDSDTNDDYLDEYEWGVNAPQPLRVVSICTARWEADDFGPTQVEAGEPCFEVG